MGIRYIDVCSGISAPTMAWKPLGWEALCFAEIEAAPRAVLQHHYPDVPLRGDFTEIEGNEYGRVDLLVGGTPCQSFSVAGLRGGLDDDRGNLALQFARLAGRARPRWVVWENVPGVLSIDGGRAFGSILGALAELGYGLAYRILDAQHFGVPQRRRRVFVVGYLGDWRRAAAVLFERHCLQGHPAPRREKGQSAPTIPSRSTGGGGLGTDFDCDGGLIEAYGGNRTSGPLDAAAALGAHGGPHGRLDFSSDTFVLMERGRNGSSNLEYRADGTANAILTPNGGRGGLGVGAVCTPFDTTQITSAANYSKPKPGDACHPLARGSHPPAVAVRAYGFANVSDGSAARNAEDLAPPITLRHGDLGCVAIPLLEIGKGTTSRGVGPNGSGLGKAGDPMFTLQAGAQHGVAFDMRGRDGGSQLEGPHDTANIRAASGGSSRSYIATSAVRRLTPRECERLQGFPDDFTLVPHRGKPMADGPRYKALGNSMAVPVLAWIGRRIAQVDALTVETSRAA